jgi:LysR family transcriptional regulator, cyn operon transcriptional activator
MNFRHLRAFATIVGAGGFARAAERLHVSQPALSRQIHALELELGISLFDRVGRGVRLTSQGEDLLTHSRRLLTELGSLSERARALKAGQAGLLRVGATPQVIESLLADFLAGYERRHPLVEVELKEAGGGAQLGSLLDSGEIEVAIMPTGDARFEERAVSNVSPRCPA